MMVSLDEFRDALGPAAEGRTDEQLAEMRERYYALAEAMIRAYTAHRTPERLFEVAAARRAEMAHQTKGRP